ncbi:sugar phosphate isomerase/epimerase [Amycolatopsis rubida]|uniref:Sugar phosphate isomerase/epimerase n=1 Tax=Amycolatopsis rubida TaxID=112413 RepID=A0ABX0BUJ2_9PSEU|nr:MULTISPECIES: TIM barrel protein [Amycolatopsis]MYW91485.1 TIM barrel protein [Amycolatopsis rubida]NEC56470.1 sugar phosphate isomerase/epimerase [Amycolatopsis rubida]OAP23487.1 Xylose isomerase-like TIM barrel [Amycolatopsis sp. M39]
MGGPSVQLYSVRDAFAADPDGTLRRLAAIGFSRVEPYGVVENVEALRAGLAAHGLSAPTAHAALVGKDQQAVFAAARELGIGIVIEPLVPAARWGSPADISDTASALNAAAEVAAGYGIRVGYHNHWWELETRIGGRSALEALADRLAPEIVLEIDAYWATAGGEDAPALLRRLGDRVCAIHVKDGSLAIDASGQVPAGQGRVPLGDVLAAAPGALRVVEFDRHEDVFGGIAESFAYLAGVGE